MDSSWIAASAHEEASRACGLGFYTCRIVDEHGNPNQDLHYSRQLCRTLGVKLNEVYVDPFDAKEFIKITMSISEQAELPVNFSLSSISLHLLTRNMHANGIKVALDGIGGDEILGGYPIYRILARSNSSAGNVVKTMAYLR